MFPNRRERRWTASTRAVCAALSIELEELDDWNCCGATHVSNELVATGLAARNMAQTDLDIMTACSICYSNLRAAAQRLEETEILEKVNAVLDRKYSGAKIRHALDVILEAFAETMRGSWCLSRSLRSPPTMAACSLARLGFTARSFPLF